MTPSLSPTNRPATGAPNHEPGANSSKFTPEQLAELSRELRGVSQLLNKAQVAHRIGITVRGVEGLVAKRKIPVIRLGHRTVKFSWPKVEAALAKLEIREV